MSAFVASFLAETAPLVGRIAFAAVFGGLVVWLLLMPSSLRGEDECAEPRPRWKQARTWAVAIAVIQFAIYLFW